jgi:cyclopropane fatty-acyl-phospholipid synthase-like methyltransferase
MAAPTTSADFDRAYRSPITVWGDLRIPSEVRDLVRDRARQSALELGCGVGRLSRYMTQQGLRVTGVDFSPVAIARARTRVATDDLRPEFCVGDVTRLEALNSIFDVALDVGCFHCLDAQGQRSYALELSRLLKPSGTHLIWAMDDTPSKMQLSPVAVREIFAPSFSVQHIHQSRRRLTRSHWYRLVRN